MQRLNRHLVRLLSAASLVSLSQASLGYGQEARSATALRLRPAETHAPTHPVVLPLHWRGPMPAVEVSVHDEGPFLFAIDTGGQGSARIQPELAERFGLQPVAEVTAGDPTGRAGRAMPVFELESLQLGDIRFEGVQAASRSYATMPDGTAIDGILGIHLFHELSLTLDYPGSRLALSASDLNPPEGAQVLDLLGDADGLPTVVAQLAGQDIEITIDTGKMGGLGIPHSQVAELPKLSEPRIVGRGQTVTGPIEIQSVKAKGSFRLGDLEFEDPTVEFTEGMELGILGSRSLAGHLISIDQRSRRLWLRSNERHRALYEARSAPARTHIDGLVEVEIDTRTGRPWLDVSVADRTEADRFLFDTGASVTVLDDDYARELDLQVLGQRPIGDPSAPAAIQADQVQIPVLRIGEARFEDLRAVIMDLDPVFAGAGGVPNAILGLPVFTDVLVTLDYGNGLLTLERGTLPETQAEAAIVPFERSFLGSPLPVLPLNIAGKIHPTHIDSGAPGLLSLPEAWLEDLELRGKPRLAGQARTVNATFSIYRGDVLDEIRLGDLTISGQNTMFMGRLQEANLGGVFLSQYVTTLDLRGQRARFLEVN